MVAATVGMLIAFAIAGAAALRGDAGARLVGAELAGVLAVHTSLLLSMQFGVPYYADVAILLALSAFVGSLLLARFLERWL